MTEQTTRYSRPKFVYLLFGLTLIPLVAWILSERQPLAERIARTVAAHPDAVKNSGINGEVDAYNLSKFLSAVPDHKLEGAFLSTESWFHWALAATSAASAIVLIWLLFDRGGVRFWRAVVLVCITAIIGMAALFALQFVGEMALLDSHVFLDWRKMLLLIVLKIIGGLYYATMYAPEQVPFFVTLGGFVFAVGFFEELLKIVAAAANASEDGRDVDWRTVCWLGLISGIWFGVLEGIFYSSSHYNGVATQEMYVVRFVSCVGLHTIWSGITGLRLARNLKWNNGKIDGRLGYLSWMLRSLAPAVVLHGTYDTFLQRDMPIFALAVAVLSFVLFAWLFESCRRNGLPEKPKDSLNIGGIAPKDWYRRGRR